MIKEQEKSKISRNVDMLVASESLFQQFREMVLAGFTKQDALYYLGVSVATLAFLKSGRKKLERRRVKKNE